MWGRGGRAWARARARARAARFGLALGPLARGLIVAIYAEPDEDTVRIISAREATRREQSLFRDYMDGIR